MRERLPGIFEIERSLATRNLVPGRRVYGEKLHREGGTEYRLWNPRRSKLSAAVLNGLSTVPIEEDSAVLYLGASTGTTASHVSDLCPEGMVYCVETSRRSMRGLLALCRLRPNMVPILADARDPLGYADLMEMCDVVYQDIAQKAQAEILLANTDLFLKKGGEAFLAVKAKSIDVTKDAREVYEGEIAKMKEGGLSIQEVVDLEPYHRFHAMIRARGPK